MRSPIVLSFSGGKDSILALAALRASPAWDPRALVATVVENDRTLAMHEVPESLVALQASSLGLPLTRIVVPRGAPDPVYEQRLGAALTPVRAEGIRHVAFGDLFLADVKAYRDALMTRLGFETVYPLWGADTREMARRFVHDGYRGVAVCVDGAKLGPEWAGRELDAEFFGSLPPGVDPCGENGEFHSFVYDGPGFAYPVRFTRAAAVTRAGFHYVRLAPLGGDACARCGATFECGMKAGGERCWCARLPPLPIDPTLAGCLCPRCLVDIARAQQVAAP